MEKNAWSIMIYQWSNNIISSLGFTTEENYTAVKQGNTGLKYYKNPFDFPEDAMLSLIDDEHLNNAFSSINTKQKTAYTRFEKAAILSAYKALEKTNIDVKSKKVVFILSTTKGNVELLDKKESELYEAERVYLWRSAQLITSFFDNPNEAIIVSNACISGAAAQITALRLLQQKIYDFAIVIGADVLSKFIISGFQSFKSLSVDICKPFDKNRCGLNLGEAAATIIYSSIENNRPLLSNNIVLLNGAIANDANHISGPSRTGDGLSIAIEKTLQNTNIQDIALINAHGTATPYNDDMESMAITANQLENIPINSLKGFLGHTLGAAGVLETILSGVALLDNMLLKSNGSENPKTICPLNIVLNNQNSFKTHFLKLLSGFGGCNAAILLKKT